jgi:hypothetical protein
MTSECSTIRPYPPHTQLNIRSRYGFSDSRRNRQSLNSLDRSGSADTSASATAPQTVRWCAHRHDPSVRRGSIQTYRHFRWFTFRALAQRNDRAFGTAPALPPDGGVGDKASTSAARVSNSCRIEVPAKPMASDSAGERRLVRGAASGVVSVRPGPSAGARPRQVSFVCTCGPGGRPGELPGCRSDQIQVDEPSTNLPGQLARFSLASSSMAGRSRRRGPVAGSA